MKHIKSYTLIFIIFIMTSAWAWYQASRPVIYLIGDSTVKNGKGKGDGGLWGWGNILGTYFDTTKILVENDALGGTSSRTFQNKGLWDKVYEKLKPGDYVIMQFGHNDGGALADTSRARGTIKGIGDDSTEVYNPILKKQEVVHSYGWYLRKYIKDTKRKGAIPVVCSPIPRNDWSEGKIKRDTLGYARWAAQTAHAEDVFFISLNEIICNHYDNLGEEKVRATLFTTQDHTHTSLEGARLNAACVVEGLSGLANCSLKSYLLPVVLKRKE
jgi:rhamnogalacturonan acetylesterase